MRCARIYSFILESDETGCAMVTEVVNAVARRDLGDSWACGTGASLGITIDVLRAITSANSSRLMTAAYQGILKVNNVDYFLKTSIRSIIRVVLVENYRWLHT